MKIARWIVNMLSKYSGNIYSIEEFGRLEKPFLEIDSVLQSFSLKYNLEFSKNSKAWPERSLEWRDCNGIKRLIQIYINNKKDYSFDLCIYAVKDKSSNRYWKKMFLKEKVPFSEISEKLDDLLEEAYRIARSWKEDDLEWATKLG